MPRSRFLLRAAAALLGLIAGSAPAVAVAASPGATLSAAPVLPPLAGRSPEPLAPWRLATLPRQKPPLTRFSVVDVDGERALRVEADASYGNLVIDLPPAPAAAVAGGTLSWRWRVDEANAAADLRSKRADDTSLKVCLLFDLPVARLPFDEAVLMRLARSRTGEHLPAATVCYVWDAREAAGSAIDNPYSRRVRYLVLRGRDAPPGRWQDERRDIAADFRRLFGDESTEVPRLLAVGIGADADNTGGRSVAHLSRLSLVP